MYIHKNMQTEAVLRQSIMYLAEWMIRSLNDALDRRWEPAFDCRMIFIFFTALDHNFVSTRDTIHANEDEEEGQNKSIS